MKMKKENGEVFWHGGYPRVEGVNSIPSSKESGIEEQTVVTVETKEAGVSRKSSDLRSGMVTKASTR